MLERFPFHTCLSLAAIFICAACGNVQPRLIDPGALAPQPITPDVAEVTPADAQDLVNQDEQSPAIDLLAELASPDPPCLAVTPGSVNFGGRKMGEIAVATVELSSCGPTPVEIYHIGMKEDSAVEFSVETTMLDHEPGDSQPMMINQGETVSFGVLYVPVNESPLTTDGEILLDEGIVEIHNNSPDPVLEIPVSGAAVCLCCPTAVIKCPQGDEVIPQTVLYLRGDESYAPQGTIQKWEWDVEQPQGSQSVFVPSYTFPNPTFEANVAGVYKFSLTVWDEFGIPSCFPATHQVVVICDETIHIELLWQTPADPDETDTGPEAGSDLDLHFLHPWAAGPDVDGDGAPDGWFDIPFDAFWFNAHPNWGSYDPGINDDPGLDRDDTDGAGPENINLDIPENVTYKVGVHYWNDHGYDSALATVRVYLYSQLVFEAADVLLEDSDMWSVCTIQWPTGLVEPILDADGGHSIFAYYQNPIFWQ